MTSASNAQYNVGRPAGVCAATGRTLSQGDRVVSTLVERVGEEGFDRLDFAEQAWAAGARPDRLVGFWRSVIPEPGERPRPYVDDEALLALFESLEDAEEHSRQAFRFVLALMLVRKRLLREEGRRSDAQGEVMLVRARGPKGWGEDGVLHEVVDPGLDRETLAQVTESIGQIMRGEE